MEKLDPRRLWLYCVLLVLFVSTIPFTPAMTGTPVWDDYDILKGDAIGANYGWTGAFTQPFNFGYFRPVVSLSFQADRALFGTNTFLYHQTNLIIHLVTVLLIVFLAKRLTRSRGAALASGLFFGIQPIQASTVSWIGGRTDSLCALFLTAFLLLLVIGATATKRKAWILVASAFALLLAMFCKEQSALAFLLVPPVYVLSTEKYQRSLRSWTATLAPFALACYVFIVLWVVSSLGMIAAEPHTLSEQLALGGRGLWHYTLLMLAPSPSVLHTFTFENSRESGMWPIFAGFLSLTVAIALVWKSWKNGSPVFLALMAVVLFTLPVSNLVPVPSLSVGPYRLGIAGPFLALVFGYLAFRFWHWKRVPTALAVGAVVVWHFGLTYWASSQWKSEEKFFDTVTRYDPAFYVARVNIAASFDTTEADAIRNVTTFLDWLYRSRAWSESDVALKMWDEDPRIAQRIKDNAGTKVPAEAFLANAFLNLGLSQLRNGQLKEGIRTLETSVSFNSLDANIHTGLGEAYAKSGDSDRAEASFQKAITIQKWHVPAHLGYAELLAKNGRLDEAEIELRAAIKWMPWHGVPYLKLATLLAKRGRREEAVGVIQSAVKKKAISQHNADDLIATMPGKSVSDDSSGHP